MKRVYFFIITMMIGVVSMWGKVPLGYTVTPAVNSIVESIKEITVTSSYNRIESVKKDFIEINGTKMGITSSIEDEVLTISLNDEITSEGQYDILIPAGTFTYVDWGRQEDSPEISYTVTIENSGNGAETGIPETALPKYYFAIPAPDSTLDAIENVTIYSTMYEDFEAIADTILINGEEVKVVAEVQGTWKSTIIFSLQKPIVKAGVYTVTIPVGTFKAEGTDLKSDFVFTYTVTGNLEGSDSDDEPDVPENPESPDRQVSVIPLGYSVSPEADSKLTEISEITITATGYSWLEGELKSIMINDVATAVISTISGDYDDVVTLTLESPITDLGTYRIVVPDGAFMVDDYDETPEIIIIYEVSDVGEPDHTAIIPGHYFVEPTAGTTLDSIAYIKVYSDYYEDFTAMNDYILINGEQKEVSTEVQGKWKNTIVFTLEKAIVEYGMYEIEIPIGTFKADGRDVSSGFKFMYNVTGDKAPTVKSDRVYDETESIVYDLDGRKVTNALPGEIYIVRQGNRVKKVMGK